MEPITRPVKLKANELPVSDSQALPNALLLENAINK